MEHIKSLHQYAKENPDKRIEIDTEALEKCNRMIAEALKNKKKEMHDAVESAKKAILSK